jgi:hypothetical protein
MMIFVKYLMNMKIIEKYLYMFEKWFQVPNIYLSPIRDTDKNDPMKNIRMLCLIAGIIVFFNSCDRDPTKPGFQLKKPKPVNLRFELGEAKDYLWAKPGSYWIYKDSASGNIDTQTVTALQVESQTIKGTREETQHITVEFDKLRRFVYSSFHQRSYYDETLNPTPDGTSFDGSNRIVCERHAKGIIFSFFNPFIIDGVASDGFSTTTCKSIIETIPLQNKTYDHVAKFEIKNDVTWTSGSLPYFTSIYYWAKNVGLIKMELQKNTPENWELIEYNIIQ